MRNLTDEQALDLAFDIVRDHLFNGVEFIDLTEHVDENMDEDEATDGDYREVSEQVETILNKLIDALVDLD